MPRRSAASLEIAGPVQIIPRPDAPYTLDDNAADVWRQIVASMPADHWHPGNYHMLEELCGYIVESRRVARLIGIESKKRKVDVAAYNNLMRLRMQVTNMINRLSRSMRLTQQAAWQPQTQHNRMKGMVAASRHLVENPWFDGADETDDADSEA